MKPFYDSGGITIYHGDCRKILRELPEADCILTDPPYGDTSLEWDVPVTSWLPQLNLKLTGSLWCFGSFKMFLREWREFSAWSMAQEIIWEKHNGTNPSNDRFRRVHELAVQFYRGNWGNVYKKPVYTDDATKRTVRRKKRPPQWGDIGASSYESQDGGPRLQRSVLRFRSCHGYAIHPTQKPVNLLEVLLSYSCPQGGLVVDPFMGSGSTLQAARRLGIRAIGIDEHEGYCCKAAISLTEPVLRLD